MSKLVFSVWDRLEYVILGLKTGSARSGKSSSYDLAIRILVYGLSAEVRLGRAYLVFK